MPTPVVIPPLRLNNQPDGDDAARVEYAERLWTMQEDVYEVIERQVEEHLRMLSGRQWDVYSPVLRQFVDASRFMSEDELRWRQRPVMDYLRYWFMVTLSKVTENQPIVGFMPNNADEHSAMLAEVMDPIAKTLWDETEMGDRLMQAASWALAAGEVYLLTRPDFTTGETRAMRGPAVIPYPSAEAEDAQDVMVEDAPFGEDGEPLVDLSLDEAGEFQMEETGDAFMATKGTVRVDVASVLEIRAQPGAQIPWNEKAWIMHRWFLTPSEVKETYGVVVDADIRTMADENAPGTLERMFFGNGHLGANRGDVAGQTNTTDEDVVNQFVCGYTLWEKPCPDYPEGRMLVVAANQVLFDGPRPFNTECAGPVRRIQFVPMPGRPIGSTPLETMVPLQKRYNKVHAQVAEHTNLCTNPILMISDQAGIDAEQFVARPGLVITHSAGSGVRPGEWLTPPALGIDVWKHLGDLRDQLFTIGSITGNDGQNPAADASGELIQQLRYNADRPLAPLTRSMEYAAAGVVQDWMAMLPQLWPFETVVHYAGEDNVLKAITVYPEMWEGSASARPVLESAAPESREKKQERVMTMYQMGLFGNIADPMEQQKAAKRALELSRFPEMTRAARPGGKHRMMAEHNLAELLRGADPTTLVLLPMYDLTVHLAVFDDYLCGPDYLMLRNQPNGMQTMEAIMAFYTQMQMALQAQQAQQMMDQSDLQMAGQAAGLLPAPDQTAPPSASGQSETKGIPNERRVSPPDIPDE